MSAEAYCQCPLAGFCGKHGIKKSIRDWQLCRGMSEGVVPATEAMAIPYRRAWDAGPLAKPEQRTRAVAGGSAVFPSAPKGKPGTELKALLAWFGAHASAGCGCTNHANTMDQRGCDWCEANIDTIVGWLADEASRSKPSAGLTLVERLANKSLNLLSKNKFAFSKSAKWQIGKAIRNARAEVAEATEIARLKAMPVPFIRVPLDRSLLVKHFAFHLLPLSDHGGWVWRRHVANIREVMPQFNGKIVISVAGHPGNQQEITRPFTSVRMTLRFDSLENVKAEFGNDADRIEFIAVTNTTSGEGVSFPLLMAKVLSDDPNHVYCYGHSKGGTHPELSPSNPCHLWSEAMWETVVSDQHAAMIALDTHAVAGSFLRVGHFHGGRGCAFHFSGTFWWGRCDESFGKRWQRVPKHYGNVEMWPGNQWQSSDAACLFGDTEIGGDASLYHENHWANTVMPRLEKWRMSLSRIATMSDKGSDHSYLPIYDEWLTPHRDKPITLVEIGVQYGHSLKLWAAAMPQATIIGIDITLEKLAGTVPDNVSAIESDVRDAADVLPESIDVLIDDGSHTEDDQQWVLEHLSSRIAPGGMLVIEDIASEDIAQRLLAACPPEFAAEYRDLTSSGRFDDRLIAFRRC